MITLSLYSYVGMYNALRIFELWFFHVLMLSVYIWGYFWPTYIRRSNVSVLAGSGCYSESVCVVNTCVCACVWGLVCAWARAPTSQPPLNGRLHPRRAPSSRSCSPPCSLVSADSTPANFLSFRGLRRPHTLPQSHRHPPWAPPCRRDRVGATPWPEFLSASQDSLSLHVNVWVRVHLIVCV